MGSSPPRPWRCGVHRSPRSQRGAAAGVPPGRRRRPRSRAASVARRRAVGQRPPHRARRRDRQPAHPDGRGRTPRPGADRACVGRAAPVLGGGRTHRGRRGHPPDPPLPRPAPPPPAGGDGAARTRAPGHPRGARGRRLPRGRDAAADQVDAGGRARLPGAQPAAAGELLCPSPEPAALQAAAHGRWHRALLPGGALLPR